MKLYTEIQLLNLISAVVQYVDSEMLYKYIESITPIELPSDEEIIEESIKHSRPQIFINGAEYIKKQINKK